MILNDNPISSAGAAALAAGVRAGHTPLESLALQRIAGFGVDAAAAFGAALGGDGGSATSGLRTLLLDRSGITDAALAALASAGAFRSRTLERLVVHSEKGPKFRPNATTCAATRPPQPTLITGAGFLALARAAAQHRFDADVVREAAGSVSMTVSEWHAIREVQQASVDSSLLVREVETPPGPAGGVVEGAPATGLLRVGIFEEAAKGAPARQPSARATAEEALIRMLWAERHPGLAVPPTTTGE